MIRSKGLLSSTSPFNKLTRNANSKSMRANLGLLGDNTVANSGPALPGETAKRDLQFFWLADCSGSMSGVRIAKLNSAIRDALGGVQDLMKDQAECAMYMRAIKFSTAAEWHVGPDPVAIENFFWPDLEADGLTATARAINLLCDQLEDGKIAGRNFSPVCVLVSDGFCTDTPSDYDRAIARLNSLHWAKNAIRLVIGIGQDEKDYDADQLVKFTNHPELGVLQARTPRDLVRFIKFVSVGSVRKSSSNSNNQPFTPNDIPPDDDLTVPDDGDVITF